ncbi:MAG: hypothetical protein AAFX99_17430, partial [Myxococcota bacterium]
AVLEQTHPDLVDLEHNTPTSTHPQEPISDEHEEQIASLMRETLEERGYRVDYDADYHKLYMINLIITRIKDVHAHVNLGVMITLTNDDLTLQEKFLEGVRRGVVHKSIYVEANIRTVSTGAVPVAISAFMSFLFDRRYSSYKCVGLRIFEDCTFHFFDIDENVRRLKRDSQDDAARIGQDMSGNIIAYFTDKGFGFIETDQDQKFFFHIANVADDDLRVQLPAYIPGDIMPVSFKYGGNDGKKYPKAVDVVLENEGYTEHAEDDYDDDY